MISTKGIIRAIAGVGLFLLFLFLIWYLRSIISYVLISAVLSIMGRPIVDLIHKIRFKKLQVPRAISALITLCLMLLLLGGFVSVFVPQIVSEAKNLSGVDINQINENLQEPLSKLRELVQKYQVSNNPDLHAEQIIQDRLNSIISATKVTDFFNSLIGALGNLFVALFSILFLTFFFLKDSNLLYDFAINATPQEYKEKTKRVLSKAKSLLTRYFIGILLQVTLITTLVTIGLSFIGIKNALLIGFFAGVINIIPYLGPLIGIAFGLIITASSNIQLDYYTELLPLLGKELIVFAVVQLLDNLVFQPFIFSNSARIHPVEVFLVIMIAGSLAGITAMIIAIPTYSFLRIVAKEFFSEFSVIQNFTKNV